MNSTLDRHAIARAQMLDGTRDLENGELDRAKEAFQSAVTAAPDLALTHYNLAVALVRLGRQTEAQRSLRAALELEPDFAPAAHLLGAVLAQLESVEEALGWLAIALAGMPDNVQARRDMGVAQLFLGQLDNARQNLLRVVEADPLSPEVLPMVVELTPAATHPAQALRLRAVLERAAAAVESLPQERQSEILIALFRAHEQRGEYDLAMDFAERAAKVKRGLVTVDMDADEAGAEAILAAFDAPLFARLAGAGVHDRRPIFIVGLPRSGTTLVEQILCAHPQVHGAGETMTLLKLLSGSRGKQGEPYPDWCPTMTAGDARLIGEAYLSRLPAAPSGRSRTTDKRLENVLNIGMIAAALPNATVIHCRRDPRDMAFSCFTTLFSSGQEWSYDIGEIARRRRLHERIMAHWREVLPGRILDVDYEDVVSDVEGQARRILDHAGLDWNEACLRFHEASRPVRSASVIQVRKPLYDSAVGRWRPFASRLGPLLEALEA